jgi:hypothetical protein
VTGAAKDWAWEAHQLAVDRAYKKADGSALPKSGHPDLDQDYVQRAKETVATQLQRGGGRLAKVVNEAVR